MASLLLRRGMVMVTVMESPRWGSALLSTQMLRAADEDVSDAMAGMEACLMLFSRHCGKQCDVARVLVAFVRLS